MNTTEIQLERTTPDSQEHQLIGPYLNIGLISIALFLIIIAVSLKSKKASAKSRKSK